MDKAKPFCIAKREVWEAYKRVKANHRVAGIDGQSIAQFQEDLSNNLYRLWNRMSSGTCRIDGDELCLTIKERMPATHCFEIWLSLDLVEYHRDGVMVTQGRLRNHR